MFKYGDIVKYVGNNYEIGIGQKFQVIQVDSGDKAFPFRITRGRGCYWVSGSDIEKTSCVYFPIDLKKPDEARVLLSRKIKEYEGRDWSEKEMAAIKELFADLLVEYVTKKHIVGKFEHNEKERSTTFVVSDCPWRISFTARAHGNDAFNPIVGEVVCLCKALGKPTPKIIEEH